MAEASESGLDEDGVLAEELAVLESIYITELTVEKDDDGWPRTVSVLLHPATGMDEDKKYVCMTLVFTIPHRYPDDVPDINVRNPRGLGEEEVQSLIEDMKKLAQDRKGGPMLFEIIEMGKDCLTEGNLPHCECAICLEHFEEGDAFVKTDCYHYFHRTCLARYAAAFVSKMQQEEEVPTVLHTADKQDDKTLGCPMCRLPLTNDLSELLVEPVPPEEKIDFKLTAELLQQQAAMAERYQQQKARGGIIDLEEERNKFLVSEDTVVSLENIRKPQESSAAEALEGSRLPAQQRRDRRPQEVRSPRSKPDRPASGRARHPRHEGDGHRPHPGHRDHRESTSDRNDAHRYPGGNGVRWHRDDRNDKGPGRDNHSQQEGHSRSRDHTRDNKSIKSQRPRASDTENAEVAEHRAKAKEAHSSDANKGKGASKERTSSSTKEAQVDWFSDGNKLVGGSSEAPQKENAPTDPSDSQGSRLDQQDRNGKSDSRENGPHKKLDAHKKNFHSNHAKDHDGRHSPHLSNTHSEKEERQEDNRHTDIRGQRNRQGGKREDDNYIVDSRHKKQGNKQSEGKGNWAHEWTRRKRHEQRSHGYYSHGGRDGQRKHEREYHTVTEKTGRHTPGTEDWDAEIAEKASEKTDHSQRDSHSKPHNRDTAKAGKNLEKETETEDWDAEIENKHDRAERGEKSVHGKSYQQSAPVSSSQSASDREQTEGREPVDRQRKDSEGASHIHDKEDQEAEARIAKRALSGIPHFNELHDRGDRRPAPRSRNEHTGSKKQHEDSHHHRRHHHNPPRRHSDGVDSQEDWEAEASKTRQKLLDGLQSHARRQQKRSPRQHIYSDSDRKDKKKRGDSENVTGKKGPSQEDLEPEIRKEGKGSETTRQYAKNDHRLSDYNPHDRDEDNRGESGVTDGSAKSGHTKQSPGKGSRFSDNAQHRNSRYEKNNRAPPGFKTGPPPGFGKRTEASFDKHDSAAKSCMVNEPPKVRPPPGFEFT